MKSILILAFLGLVLALSVSGDRVDTSKACSKMNKAYAGGAAEFIADMLALPYQPAKNYVQGNSIGAKSPFTNAQPGDVVGFPGGMHWLAIYVGMTDCPCMFLDVPDSSGNVRCWKGDYGTEVYEYSYPH